MLAEKDGELEAACIQNERVLREKDAQLKAPQCQIGPNPPA